jgi:hypothetical protein
MGIEIRLLDQHGQVIYGVPDPYDLTAEIIALVGADSPALQYVDRAGDTTFNSRQAELIVTELDLLTGRVPERLEAMASCLHILAMRCAWPDWIGTTLQRRRRYLRFVGV